MTIDTERLNHFAEGVRDTFAKTGPDEFYPFFTLEGPEHKLMVDARINREDRQRFLDMIFILNAAIYADRYFFVIDSYMVAVDGKEAETYEQGRPASLKDDPRHVEALVVAGIDQDSVIAKTFPYHREAGKVVWDTPIDMPNDATTHGDYMSLLPTRSDMDCMPEHLRELGIAMAQSFSHHA